MKIVALMPMKHHSDRVPGKNLKPLGEAPLFHHVLRRLLESRHISEVVIDTDSPEITKQCAERFPSVRIVDRPLEPVGEDP
jgi:CMP-N-acetylneuraminic acid synthetase